MACADFTVTQDESLNGGDDIQRIFVGPAGVSQCCSECQTDPACIGFTLDDEQHCWLKSGTVRRISLSLWESYLIPSRMVNNPLPPPAPSLPPQSASPAPLTCPIFTPMMYETDLMGATSGFIPTESTGGLDAEVCCTHCFQVGTCTAFVVFDGLCYFYQGPVQPFNHTNRIARVLLSHIQPAAPPAPPSLPAPPLSPPCPPLPPHQPPPPLPPATLQTRVLFRVDISSLFAEQPSLQNASVLPFVVTGDFDDWCAGSPMCATPSFPALTLEPARNGVYERQVLLQPTSTRYDYRHGTVGAFRYKFARLGWEYQEVFGAQPCTVGPDPNGYYNRVLSPSMLTGGDVMLPTVCWDSCEPCLPQNASRTDSLMAFPTASLLAIGVCPGLRHRHVIARLMAGCCARNAAPGRVGAGGRCRSGLHA